MKLTFISDPGHGWLEVPIHLIEKLGIKNKISKYSYRKNNLAFLEEDCDASLFIQEFEKSGEKIEFGEKYQEQTFIRDLPRFYP